MPLVLLEPSFDSYDNRGFCLNCPVDKAARGHRVMSPGPQLETEREDLFLVLVGRNSLVRTNKGTAPTQDYRLNPSHVPIRG